MNNATEKVWARIESITGNSNRSSVLEQKASGENSNKDGVSGKDDRASSSDQTNKPE
jgi:hypothetical protein